MLNSNDSEALEGKQWKVVWPVVERIWCGESDTPALAGIPFFVNLLYGLGQVICKMKTLMIPTWHGHVYSK